MLIKAVSDTLRGKSPSLAHRRSGKWPTVRKNFLLLNPRCAVCDGSRNLEVHHKKPFHVEPALELIFSNLITLCESKKSGINCHLFVGHLGNFKNINPNVVEDAAFWKAKLQQKNY